MLHKAYWTGDKKIWISYFNKTEIPNMLIKDVRTGVLLNMIDLQTREKYAVPVEWDGGP